MRYPVRTLLKHLLGQPSKSPKRTRLEIGGLEERTVPTVAYAVPAATAGNQNFGGSLGMDFDVTGGSPITVTALGAFDSNSDGIIGTTISVRLYDRTSPAAPIATALFTGMAGTLIGGSRFSAISPLVLPNGFQGRIVADGYNATEMNGNSGGSWTTNTDGGAISFVGTGYFGAAGLYPNTADGGPANRYAAGTFIFNDPFAGNDAITAAESTSPIMGNVTTNDAIVGAYTVSQVGGPLAGLTLNADGSFSFSNTDGGNPNTVHTFQYSITDTLGTSNTATATITVNNVPPTINTFTLPAGVLEGGTANLAATATDPAGAGDPLTYSWTVTGPGIVGSLNLSGTNPSFTALDSGTFTVSLTVTDGDGGNAITGGMFNVANVAPDGTTTTTPAPALALSPTVNTIVRNSPHTFTISGITDPAMTLDESYTITWNFGDGSPVVSSGPLTYAALSGGPHSQTYNFPTTGTFNTVITVTDSDGASTTDTYVVNVVAVAVINGELHIGGTSANNIATITPGSPANSINVVLDNVLYGPFSPTGTPTPFPAGAPIRFFGGAGTDTFIIAGTSGNDTFTVGADVPNGATNLVMDKQFSFNSWPTITTKDAEAYQLKGGTGNNTFTVDGIGSDPTSVANDTNVFLEGGIGADSITTTLTSGEVGGVADWNITGPQRGSLETNLTFNWVESLVDGGDISDNFVFQNGASMPGAPGIPVGIVANGGETNTMNMAASTTAVSITFTGANTMNTSQGPASGINNLIGSNATTDRITGANLAAIWNVTDLNTGNYSAGTTVNFAGFETLVGGTGVDEFIFDADGRITGQLDGGSQPGGSRDIIDVTARTTAVTVTVTPPRIMGGLTNLVGSWSSVEELQGSAVAGNTLTGANGANIWTLTGANDGTLNALTFSDFPILNGGTSTDSFVLTNSAGSIATANGGGGTDTLTYAGATGPISVNVNSTTGGAAGSGSQVTNFTGIDSVIGSSNPDTLTGTAGVDAFAINSVNGGTLNVSLPFVGFEVLNGNAGNDTYQINTTTSPALTSLVAGAGTDTLIGPNRTNAWAMTGAGAGTLNGTTFSGMENLTGGSGVDTFSFTTGSITGILNGGGHNDILQLGANNVTLTSNVNGTTTGGLMAGFVSIENLQASGTSTLNGHNAANIWRLTGANAGTLNSTTIFSGFSNLVGNASQDRLQPYQGYVTSFNAGGGTNDVLDYAGTSTADVPRPYNVTPAMLTAGTVLSGDLGFFINITNFEIVSGNIYA